MTDTEKALRAEVARLEAKIAAAPHAPGCPGGTVVADLEPCICWKSATGDAAIRGTLDRLAASERARLSLEARIAAAPHASDCRAECARMDLMGCDRNGHGDHTCTCFKSATGDKATAVLEAARDGHRLLGLILGGQREFTSADMEKIMRLYESMGTWLAERAPAAPPLAALVSQLAGSKAVEALRPRPAEDWTKEPTPVEGHYAVLDEGHPVYVSFFEAGEGPVDAGHDWRWSEPLDLPPVPGAGEEGR